MTNPLVSGTPNSIAPTEFASQSPEIFPGLISNIPSKTHRAKKCLYLPLGLRIK